MDKKPVIYKIENLDNGKFYVGSTGNFRERMQCHKIRLRAGIHHSKHLQAAWNLYGEEAFAFVVVEEVPTSEDLQVAEERWLSRHFGKPHCYNASRYADAPMRGRPKEEHSCYGVPKKETTKKKISRRLKEFYAEDPSNHPRLGKSHNEETRRKISEKVNAALSRGGAGKYKRSEETLRKLSESLKGNTCAKGYKRTEAERKAISERVKGNKNFLGKKHSEETRLKMGKPIIVTQPDGAEKHYATITIFRAESGLLIPTVQRALKSGQPLKKGPFKGYSFRYA